MNDLGIGHFSGNGPWMLNGLVNSSHCTLEVLLWCVSMSPYTSSIMKFWKWQDLKTPFCLLHSIFFVMFMGLYWRMHGINGPCMLLDSISFSGLRMSSLPKTWAYYSSVLMKVERNSKNFRHHIQSHRDHSFPVKGNGPTYSLHLTYCKFVFLTKRMWILWFF